MNKFLGGLFAFGLMAISVNANAASLKETTDKLTNSVTAILFGSDKTPVCTASKINDFQYLTASHCIEKSITLRTSKGQILHPKSVLISMDELSDWAIINTKEDDVRVKSLELACNVTPYLGMEVAYVGFPFPVNVAFGMGHVTSTNELKYNGKVISPDVLTDIPAAPGASGSPVIDMETGQVIGILTTGISSRMGVFMIGIETIKSLDICNSTVKHLPDTSDAAEK